MPVPSRRFCGTPRRSAGCRPRGSRGTRGRSETCPYGAMVTPSAQTPERGRESEAAKDGLRLLERAPAPRRLAAIFGVPDARQLPALRDRNHRAFVEAPRRAPAINVFFRPEEEHRPSRVDDVLPP